MKPTLLLFLIATVFFLAGKIHAQSFAINSIHLSKEASTTDSSIQYTLTATIDLADTNALKEVHCKIKGVSSDTAYFEANFVIPQTEGTFINGIMKDRYMLFLNLGTFMLREPVLLETGLIDRDNNRSNTYQTNE
ncbi:MAG: hypothetical protein K0S33_1875 [Bacteroidetes bacterium]|jgi:hypothetical protein|nr:hypothetical protein [Bacteroidota bacterium]